MIIIRSDAFGDAEGAVQKLSGKRNRPGQHSGEHNICTEELSHTVAGDRANISGKRTEADKRISSLITQVLVMVFMLSALFAYSELFVEGAYP